MGMVRQAMTSSLEPMDTAKSTLDVIGLLRKHKVDARDLQPAGSKSTSSGGRACSPVTLDRGQMEASWDVSTDPELQKVLNKARMLGQAKPVKIQLGCLYRSRAPEGAQQGKDAGTSKACQNSASEQDPAVQSDRRSDQKEPEEPSTWCPCQMVLRNPPQKSHWVWQVWRYVEGPEGEVGEPDQEGDGGGLHARGPDRQIHLLVHHEPEGAV